MRSYLKDLPRRAREGELHVVEVIFWWVAVLFIVCLIGMRLTRVL